MHYFISIIAILVMTTMFQNWKVAQEEQTGQELILNQVSDMKKHIGEVEKLYQDIRSLRHDMGNHIQMLEHLETLLKDLILKLSLQTSLVVFGNVCGNVFTRIIIDSFM